MAKNKQTAKDRSPKNRPEAGKQKVPAKKPQVSGGRVYGDSSWSLGKNYYLIPLLIVLVLLPFAVRLQFYYTNLSSYPWFTYTDRQADVFLRFRGHLFVVLAVIMLVLIVYRLLQNPGELKRTVWLIPLAGYACLSVISTFAGKYRWYGIHGMYEQHETIWVLLGYCILFVYAYMVTGDANSVRVLRKGTAVLAVVLIILGLTQLTGHDFFESSLGKLLIVPQSLENQYGIRDDLHFTFSQTGNHQVYLTFYNPNYVGVFSALMMPIFLGFAFAAKKLWKKILWALFTFALFMLTMGAGSKTFVLSVLLCAVVAALFCRKSLKKMWWVLVVGAAVLVAGGAFYFNSVNVSFTQYLGNALALHKNQWHVTDIRTYDDHAEIDYEGNTLSIAYEIADGGGVIDFCKGTYSTDAEMLTYTMSDDGENVMTLDDEAFHDMSFRLVSSAQGQVGVEVTAPIEFWDEPVARFRITKDDSGYRFMTSTLRADDIVWADAAVFDDYNAIATRRGYMWSRCIPLLGKYFLLGAGQDSFTIAFPQQDYVAGFNSGFAEELITKPHNMYLQIGVQDGVVALLCYLAVAVIYLVQSAKLYWKNPTGTGMRKVGFAIAVGILGYLVAGLTNDSMVCLAPFYWLFLGVGFAVNRNLENAGE